MNDRKKLVIVIIAAILGTVGIIYLSGIIGQVISNYTIWLSGGGINGQQTMKRVLLDPVNCYR